MKNILAIISEAAVEAKIAAAPKVSANEKIVLNVNEAAIELIQSTDIAVSSVVNDDIKPTGDEANKRIVYDIAAVNISNNNYSDEDLVSYRCDDNKRR